jgi:hypothetical protein
MNNKYNEEKHDQLLEVGRKIEKGITHPLEDPFVDSILGTLQFFGANPAEMQQFTFDLKAAKYKIWDFLGMNYDSKYMQSKPVFVGLDKLVDLYIKMKDVGGFAWFLRGHDLDIEEPKKCADCIKSYKDWKSKSPAQLAAEQKEKEDFFGGVIDIA